MVPFRDGVPSWPGTAPAPCWPSRCWVKPCRLCGGRGGARGTFPGWSPFMARHRAGALLAIPTRVKPRRPGLHGVVLHQESRADSPLGSLLWKQQSMGDVITGGGYKGHGDIRHGMAETSRRQSFYWEARRHYQGYPHGRQHIVCRRGKVSSQGDHRNQHKQNLLFRYLRLIWDQ